MAVMVLRLSWPAVRKAEEDNAKPTKKGLKKTFTDDFHRRGRQEKARGQDDVNPISEASTCTTPCNV